jgi:gluconate 2-dehydrogenase alpha chain
MVGAKAQPSTLLMPLLVERKNFHLRTGCWVRRVLTRDGKAEGVSFVDASGNEFLQPADIVILASWTINNVRLLLSSKVGRPYDPATGTGTLGKNLTHQVGQSAELLFDKSLNGFMGSGGLGVAIGDVAGDPPASDFAAGVIRGGTIQAMTSGEGPLASFGKMPAGEVKTNWGSEWKKASLRWYDKSATITSRDMHLAYRHNFMDLDPTYSDRYGDPLLRLTLDWTDQERRQAAMLGKIELSIAKATGAKSFRLTESVGAHYSSTMYQGTHIQGGAITGSSRQDSVVNTWLQHWDVSNLWVVGGSSFPQNECTPTLTIISMTYRAADALVEKYVKRPGALA